MKNEQSLRDAMPSISLTRSITVLEEDEDIASHNANYLEGEIEPDESFRAYISAAQEVCKPSCDPFVECDARLADTEGTMIYFYKMVLPLSRALTEEELLLIDQLWSELLPGEELKIQASSGSDVEFSVVVPRKLDGKERAKLADKYDVVFSADGERK